MRRTIVISQPMFFPWVGLFEQIRLADVYVHYDDVQFSKGSFGNRVQIKTVRGAKWLSVPLRDLRLGSRIAEVAVDDRQDWRQRHLAVLEHAYAAAPYQDEMLALVKATHSDPATSIGRICVLGIEKTCEYFDLGNRPRFLLSSSLNIPGHSSQRVLDIVRALEGTIYVTGHGARNYLDHELFEQHGIRVEYMDYRRLPYPQLHGEFTPQVSILDLVANCGKAGRDVIASGTVYWRDFLTE